MTLCLVSTGSNLGHPEEAVTRVIQALRDLPHYRQFKQSRLHKSKPIGGPAGQGPYVNAVVRFETDLSPNEILGELQALEAKSLRDRSERWSARPIDLDLLAVGQQVIREPHLRLPHPRMSFRPFVLEPATEVASEWIHPELDQSVESIWRCLRQGIDQIQVLGEHRKAVAALIEAELQIIQKVGIRPQIKVDSEIHTNINLAKLQIDSSSDGDFFCQGPTLRLADSPNDDWRSEVLAAIECVWPRDNVSDSS